MSGDYLEQLSATSLDLLARAAGVSPGVDVRLHFASRPNDVRLALASPEVDQLLTPERTDQAPPLLKLAVAVHRTAEAICTSGWTAHDEAPIDLALVQFAGQGEHQRAMVGLLACFLPSRRLEPLDLMSEPDEPGSLARLIGLLDLADQVAETERAGALRLLGDEALFASSMFAGRCVSERVDDELIARIDTVLPRAVRNLNGELHRRLHTVLDVYLLYGPVWYQMAAQNLLHRSMRRTLATLATEFSTARRFLVSVAQGPLAPLLDDLYRPKKAEVPA